MRFQGKRLEQNGLSYDALGVIDLKKLLGSLESVRRNVLLLPFSRFHVFLFHL
jgi:hypothetical protein